MAYGFGQTASPEPCGFLDTLMGTCVQNPETIAETAGGYTCNWLQNFFDPSGCASAASPTPVLPVLPSQPNVTLSTGAPMGAGYTSVIAGTDSNGNTIYANTPTAQAQQQANVASITSQVASGVVDCTQWYNQLFNPACPCNYCSSLSTWGLIAAGIVGFTFLMAMVKK